MDKCMNGLISVVLFVTDGSGPTQNYLRYSLLCLSFGFPQLSRRDSLKKIEEKKVETLVTIFMVMKCFTVLFSPPSFSFLLLLASPKNVLTNHIRGYIPV